MKLNTEIISNLFENTFISNVTTAGWCTLRLRDTSPTVTTRIHIQLFIRLPY